MSEIRLGGEYIREGRTEIDNLFLSRYLPDADGTDVKIYLYGLYLAAVGGGDTQKIALGLRLTEERVQDAFAYWEDQGLVTMTASVPPVVVYNPVTAPVTKEIRYNAREYSEFVDELRRVFGEKELPVGDIVRYIEIIRRYKIDPNAMLLIAGYCIERGKSSTPYVLSVAANWAKEGVSTEEAVNAKISEMERGSEDMRLLFKALGLKSEPSFEDKNTYLYWTKECGFRPDAVLQAARYCKNKGGMRRLTKFMEELRSAGAFTPEEVADYQKRKDELNALTADVVHNLGAYYPSLDAVTETYINPWLSYGFEPEALRELSKFCFRRNIKTPENMNVYVEKLYKLGLVTVSAIDSYIKRQAALDQNIREIKEAAGAEPLVSSRDREFYRTFTETWGFDHETVLAVAKHATGKPFPMSYINKILLIFKDNGITSAEGASAFFASDPAKKSGDRLITQNYSEAELSGVFRSLDELNPDDEDI